MTVYSAIFHAHRQGVVALHCGSVQPTMWQRGEMFITITYEHYAELEKDMTDTRGWHRSGITYPCGPRALDYTLINGRIATMKKAQMLVFPGIGFEQCRCPDCNKVMGGRWWACLPHGLEHARGHFLGVETSSFSYHPYPVNEEGKAWLMLLARE